MGKSAKALLRRRARQTQWQRKWVNINYEYRRKGNLVRRAQKRRKLLEECSSSKIKSDVWRFRAEIITVPVISPKVTMSTTQSWFHPPWRERASHSPPFTFPPAGVCTFWSFTGGHCTDGAPQQEFCCDWRASLARGKKVQIWTKIEEKVCGK